MPTIRVAEADVSYRLTGAGPVTVVITQGLGFASAEWWPIQDALSSQARVLTWDRPGYGDSGPPRSPRTVANVAAEALGLIDVLAPHGPLVLVGHSQGGLYTNALARLAGTRVLGVALLDPASPDNGRLRRELPPTVFRRSGADLAMRLRLANTFARLHVIRAFKPMITKAPPFSYCQRHPREALSSMWRHLTHPQAYQAALAEYEELEFRTIPGDVLALGPFPQVPLVLLVHDPAVLVGQMSAHLPRADAERVEALWGALLRDHPSLSSLATLETVAGSGHLIHLERPEVTTATIGALLEGK